MNTVIVDLPRTGLADNVPTLISSWNAEMVVYVSCFLKTLLRDLERFKKLGYTTIKAGLFDFYPNTPHVETVVFLSQAKGNRRESL